MKISEIFQSHQGEGLNAGQFCTFIRFSGCNLSCPFCDTQYATDGSDMNIVDVLPELSEHIVFTGGEPFIQERAMYEIIDAKEPVYTEVETNGTIIPSFPEAFNLITVSPKSNIKYQDWLDFPNTIFKFAVSDISHVLEIVQREGIPKDRVYVMPVTAPDDNPVPIHQTISEQCRIHGINFSPRLQVLLGWGRGL